jgi:hypothetical protein
MHMAARRESLAIHRETQSRAKDAPKVKGDPSSSIPDRLQPMRRQTVTLLPMRPTAFRRRR